MKGIVYLLGFAHIAVCTYLILYTKEFVNLMKGFFNTYELKYLSAIPAGYALLFLVSASATIHPWIFRFVGLLAVVEAVVLFINPRKIYSRMLDWYFNSLSDQAKQVFGIFGIVFGTVILTWI